MSYYLVSCIGLTFLLKYAKILKHYRDHWTSKDEFFKDLFGCSLCLGFWVGMIHIPFISLCQGTDLKLLLLPTVSSAIAWFADSTLQMIQAAELLMMKHVKDKHAKVNALT
jgi:hypothetical protein